MGKDKPAKKTRAKKNDNGEFSAEDSTIYFDLFKQLKGQFYKERGEGPRSTLETLKESLGGSVLKDVTFFYQKLNKKSSETIVKTLKEFFTLLQEKEAAFFVSLMASYSIIHEKLLTTEFERDIFIWVLRIDELIIAKNKDAVKKHFRVFYPAWFLIQHESMEDVKQQAIKNLHSLLPEPEKHSLAFLVSQDNFLSLVQTWLQGSPVQFKDINLYLEDYDCERVHSRLLSLTIRSLQHSLQLVDKEEDKEDYYPKLRDVLKLEAADNTIVQLFSQMSKDYGLRAELAQFYLRLVEAGVEDVTQKHAAAAIKAFLGQADAKEPKLQQVFWEFGLYEALLPGIKLKPDQYNLKDFFKKSQSILEIGGMGIGKTFFANFNQFILKTPLFDYSAQTSSKKFCGAIGENFKQVEGYVKAYLACLEQDVCKFFMNDIVASFFDFSYQVLFGVVLKLRSDIKAGSRFNDGDLTEALRKQVEATFEKYVDLFVLAAVDTYLDKNSPDNMSELAIGFNNYKFIPKHFAAFLKRLLEDESQHALQTNIDTLERSLNKLASGIPKLAADKKKFESFLALVDALARESLVPRSTEAKGLLVTIQKMFETSSNFLTSFTERVLQIDEVEQAFNKEAFVNFIKYLSKILASQAPHNVSMCASILPSISAATAELLKDALGDSFDLFEDNDKRLEILKAAFGLFYTIQDWKFKHNKTDVAEIELVFKALDPHCKSLLLAEEDSLSLNHQSLATLLVALNPELKTDTVKELLKARGKERKEFAISLSQTHQFDKKLQFFQQLTVSQAFCSAISVFTEKLFDCKTYLGMALYEPSLRLCHFLKEDKILLLLDRALQASNNKDECIGYKLNLFEARFADLLEANKKTLTLSLFKYINASRSFPTDQVIIKAEKFMVHASPKFKTAVITNMAEILCSHIQKGSDGQQKSEMSQLSYESKNQILTLFDFYLDKFLASEDIGADSIKRLVNMVTNPLLFESSLHQLFVWQLLRVVMSKTKGLVDLKEHFSARLQTADAQDIFVQYCILAAPSCLQIVLNHDLKKFILDLGSLSILPNVIALRSKDRPAFVQFLQSNLDLAVKKDIQFIYGLRKILLDLTGDELNEDSDKEEVFRLATSWLREARKSLASEDLSSLVEITSNIVSYFNRNMFKSDFGQRVRSEQRSRLLKLLHADDRSAAADEEETVITSDYTGVEISELVFEFSLYLAVCKLTKGNKIAEFKQLAFDVYDNLLFTAVKKEISLTILFRFLNIAIEENELHKFAEDLGKIELAFNEGLSIASFGHQKNLLLVSQLEFLRRVITIIEMFSKQFEATINKQILKLAISKVKELNELDHTTSDTFADYGCGFDELLVEIAETLSRFCISFQSSISENELYLLLNCLVPVVQKGAIVVLNDFYINRVNPSTITVDDDGMEKLEIARSLIVPELLKVIESRTSGQDQAAKKVAKKVKGKQVSEILEIKEANHSSDLSLFSYMLTWIQLMQRLKTQRLADSEEQKSYDYFISSNPELYFAFLNNIFKWIVSLKIPSKELESRIQKIQIQEIPLYWTDYIDQNTILELLLYGFFRFCSSFPKYLRNWVDNTDKRYSDLAKSVVRQKVSGLILEYEIEQIDNKEPGSLSSAVWRSEEFSISTFRNTREVEANYTKEDAQLSIKFTLPECYPIE